MTDPQAWPDSPPPHGSPHGDGPANHHELPAEDHELEVDLSSFLPEGVSFGDPQADPEPTAAVDPEPEPGPSPEPAVDTTVLEQMEAEFAQVEAALGAIDAGAIESSPLLNHLLNPADPPG